MFVLRPLAILPLVALAHCGPLAGRNPQCSTGQVSCCQQMQSASNSPLANALSMLGLLDGLLEGDGQLGVQCSSLTGAGSSTKCESNTVCCNGTSMNGFINFGCSPLVADL